MASKGRKQYAPIYTEFFRDLRSFGKNTGQLAFCPKSRCGMPISQLSNGYRHVQQHHPEDVTEKRAKVDSQPSGDSVVDISTTDDVVMDQVPPSEFDFDAFKKQESQSLVGDVEGDVFFKVCNFQPEMFAFKE